MCLDGSVSFEGRDLEDWTGDSRPKEKQRPPDLQGQHGFHATLLTNLIPLSESKLEARRPFLDMKDGNHSVEP